MIEPHKPYEWDYSSICFDATWENDNLTATWEGEVND
jgi:hypothetical protein